MVKMCQQCSFVKFGFSEKATKVEKDLRRTFDKSVVFYARNSVLVKKSTKILLKNVDKSYYTNFKESFEALWKKNESLDFQWLIEILLVTQVI